MALNAVIGGARTAGRIAGSIGMKIVEGLVVGGVAKIGDMALRIKEVYDALVPSVKKYAKVVIQAIVFAVGYAVGKRFALPEVVKDAMIYSLGVDIIDMVYDQAVMKRKVFVYYDKKNDKLVIEGASTPLTICIDGNCKTGMTKTELVKDQDITVESGHCMVIVVDADGDWDVEYVPYKIGFKTSS